MWTKIVLWAPEGAIKDPSNPTVEDIERCIPISKAFGSGHVVQLNRVENTVTLYPTEAKRIDHQ